MRFTALLKRMLASRQTPGASRRQGEARWLRLDDLEFNVIPATDDHLYDQDVRPALLAQFLAMRKSR